MIDDEIIGYRCPACKMLNVKEIKQIENGFPGSF